MITHVPNIPVVERIVLITKAQISKEMTEIIFNMHAGVFSQV